MNFRISILLLIIGIFVAIYSFWIVDKNFEYTNEQFLQTLFSSKKYKGLNKEDKEAIKKVRKFLTIFVISSILIIIALNMMVN